MDFSQFTYTVSNRNEFSLTEALGLWKAKYPEFIDFEKDVIKHPGLQEFGEFVRSVWEEIQPVTVQDALAQENAEIRRTYFDCIGVKKLFNDLEPELLDRQVINKVRIGWNDDNDPVRKEFEDVYELYKIDGKKMFKENRWGNAPDPVYAVRCWCTTTNREYWLYVPRVAATGQSWLGSSDTLQHDAIRAIAWTIRIDVENPEAIYRQGDIIVVKLPENPKHCREYHITKDQYLNLMYSES
jgi:hypothetical protein